MAKISAHGDSKAHEWKSPEGCRLVLTVQGRFLRNYLKGDGLSHVGRSGGGGITLAAAEAYAARLGFERVM